MSSQMLKELSDVENQLSSKNQTMAGSYITTLCLHIVAVLRKYQGYLYVNHDLTLLTLER